MLHTHSSIYHPRCIMFFSQYFSFPLTVPFYHRSIHIHPSTTHDVQCFSPSTSVFPCQYHSTITLCSFIHLPHTLYNVFLPVRQFSPVSIIPPLLHTHSSIYQTLPNNFTLRLTQVDFTTGSTVLWLNTQQQLKLLPATQLITQHWDHRSKRDRDKKKGNWNRKKTWRCAQWKLD
jgi:hypothetical protein